MMHAWKTVDDAKGIAMKDAKRGKMRTGKGDDTRMRHMDPSGRTDITLSTVSFPVRTQFEYLTLRPTFNWRRGVRIPLVSRPHACLPSCHRP